MDQPTLSSNARLTTPRAAAVAGILFSVLLITSLVLVRISVPPDPQDAGDWLSSNWKPVSFALGLVPFAGIAFLWFIGVVRDRLGQQEDRFFATVFLGSGLLFLAMLFASAAISGGIISIYGSTPAMLVESGVYAFGRTVIYQIMNIYTMKMAGVFMISTCTLSLRTGIIPRWMAYLGIVLAVFLLLSSSFFSWSPLVFPLWVLLISVYILLANLRSSRTLTAIGLSVVLFALAGCAASQPGSGGDLTGKVWALSELSGKPLVPGTGITAQFSADGKVSGSAGCNRYGGTYTISGNTITFGSPLAATMMMCEPAVMEQESAYLKALGEAKTFSVSGDQLTLLDADKASLAVYQAQNQDLAGTAWEAIGYNNGKQAVTSVLAGTSLSANFGQDGQLSGNAGCNNYNGPYKVNGSQITIGPLASTRKACSDPAGVMDQEMQYLAALQSAATYQIEGNVLELRTKDGALAADFRKK